MLALLAVTAFSELPAFAGLPAPLPVAAALPPEFSWPETGPDAIPAAGLRGKLPALPFPGLLAKPLAGLLTALLVKLLVDLFLKLPMALGLKLPVDLLFMLSALLPIEPAGELISGWSAGAAALFFASTAPDGMAARKTSSIRAWDQSGVRVCRPSMRSLANFSKASSLQRPCSMMRLRCGDR